MAQIFLTLSEELGASKLAVVKQLRPELSRDEEHRAMFLNEARLAVRLHDPNIVQTFEVGELEGSYFMAMEYLEGQPLNVVLQRSTREQFPVPLHLHVMLEVLRGLAYAHELTDFDGKPLSVVHRDVSPHNVFLTYDGQVKVVDFGIAKANSTKEQTKTGIFKGKPTYASPEQALGEAVDQRADVYSAGVMLWEAIARRRMWAGRSDTSILVDLVNGTRPKLLDVVPYAPPALASICEKALAQSPDDRFSSSREFLEAVEEYLNDQSHRVGSKELSARMSELFWSERERIRATIEEQVRLPDDVRIPVDEDGPAPPTLLQLAGLAPIATESGQRTKTAPSRRGIGLLIGGAAVIAALGVGLGVMRASKSADASEIAAKGSAAGVVPSAQAADQRKTVKIAVRTDPEGATVLLDGQPFDASKELPKDSSTHRLAISAVGFEPQRIDVVLTGDQSLSVALRPSLPAPSMTTPRPAAIAKGTPAASTPKPSAGRSDSIDEESPYKR
jgi:serine/threonine-protein kinase